MIEHIKKANKDAGYYFFEPDTLRFFKSRISSRVFEGSGGFLFFVTSEEPPHGERRWTVRVFDPETGQCDTAKDQGHTFMEFKSWGAAATAAQRTARGWTEPSTVYCDGPVS